VGGFVAMASQVFILMVATRVLKVQRHSAKFMEVASGANILKVVTSLFEVRHCSA
jgi:hypothetical protein